MVAYVTFLGDVACQKLLNSANVSRSYSQNNTGTVFLRHGVYRKLKGCFLLGAYGKWPKAVECSLLTLSITSRDPMAR